MPNSLYTTRPPTLSNPQDPNENGTGTRQVPTAPAPPTAAPKLAIGPTPVPSVASNAMAATLSDTPENSWLYARISGIPTPGTIPKGGMRGFRRETGWEEKKGKGSQGATLTKVSAPPVKGTVTLQLYVPQDFSDWDAFVASVLTVDQGEQAAAGLQWYYPGHNSIGLVSVVIASYTGPELVGAGIYHATIDVIEWAQPPAQSIVSTVATTLPDQGNSSGTGPVGLAGVVALQQVTANILAGAPSAQAP